MALCPHCRNSVCLAPPRPAPAGEAPLRVSRQVLGILKKEVMYVCPHCDVVLGFGHFKGGWLTGRPN